MATVAHTTTLEEYLAAEEASVERHEYVNGIVVAMSGGTERHSLLGAAMIVALTTRLRGGPCRTYTSDQRIFVPETKLMAYPDVSVICGSFGEIAEGSTRDHQPQGARRDPLRGDRELRSRRQVLQAYVLVDQDAPRLEVYCGNEPRAPVALPS